MISIADMDMPKATQLIYVFPHAQTVLVYGLGNEVRGQFHDQVFPKQRVL